jgi:hypothetical protein
VRYQVGREPGSGPAQLTCPNTDTDHSDQSVPVLFVPLFLEGLVHRGRDGAPLPHYPGQQPADQRIRPLPALRGILYAGHRGRGLVVLYSHKIKGTSHGRLVPHRRQPVSQSRHQPQLLLTVTENRGPRRHGRSNCQALTVKRQL